MLPALRKSAGMKDYSITAVIFAASTLSRKASVRRFFPFVTAFPEIRRIPCRERYEIDERSLS